MLYWDVDLSETNVLFWWQKRTRKPPAISTRWIHEKGAARPFQTPKELSKRKKASRFAKRFFLVSPVYGFAENSKPSAFLSERDIIYFYNSEVIS